jgi:aconitate hydratase
MEPEVRETGLQRVLHCSGVRAVIAESFERIHRSNLIGMGVLPSSVRRGRKCSKLGITGEETFEITGMMHLHLMH